MNEIVVRVAPRVGAWIETHLCRYAVDRPMSHPVWVRGLKLVKRLGVVEFVVVAPRVGAWIETERGLQGLLVQGVAPRVGAWIETQYYALKSQGIPSHPVWVRGLKHLNNVCTAVVNMSHPVWVRGLKPLACLSKSI